MFGLRKAAALTLLTLTAFVVALVAALPTPVQKVEANSLCGVETVCINEATIGLSSITARHEEILSAGNKKVQITAPDTWNIEVEYVSADDDNSPLCSCDEPTGHSGHPFMVTASVTWNTTTGTWDADCTAGCDANGPVYDVVACDLSSSICNTGGMVPVYQSHAYKLMVVADLEVYDSCPGGTGRHFLDKVVYEVTPANGLVLDMDGCTLGLTVKTPISTTYTNNDGGAFECDQVNRCNAAAGPEILLTYQ